ncbi:MAG: LEA type 2 family protein [Pseudomonas sp.]|uniref:LEA type 2 family protein n=1 Tax=Pseudomonas abieticivorans TaxID=2931382 RepID=UPI0020C058E6|nr:LEA type 2 family protein [Pseudomonas sp. PIA16]MDE1165899.1 LEA type 2 family protein [Pseudomonas sp.]
MIAQAYALRTVALLLLLSLGGCSTWFTGGFQDAQVHLVKVEVVKAKLLQQQFVLHFSIDNPNDSSLPVRGLRYRIHLADILLADGDYDEWFTVAANSRGYFQVPIRTNLWQHLRDVVKLLRHPDRPIPYRLEGELSTGLFFGHTQQLSRSGEIIPGDLIPE